MILFVPLDIPPIPNKEKILENFYGSTKVVGYDADDNLMLVETDKAKIDSANDVFYKWQTQHLLEDGVWNKFARETYPELVGWIDDNFPFTRKLDVRLDRAQQSILPHTDAYDWDNHVFEGVMTDSKGNSAKIPYANKVTNPQTIYNHQLENEPIGYRFIVSGSRDSLYMCNEKNTQEKIFCSTPKETDAYVINHCTQMHGMDPKESVDDDRVVGFIDGMVDPIKHQQLIEKSLEVYKSKSLLKQDLPWHNKETN